MDQLSATEQRIQKIIDRTFPAYSQLFKELPAVLSGKEIASANKKKININSYRRYAYDGIVFDILPNVFEPGGTSAILFEKIKNRTTNLAGKTVLVMGCGAGVETVLLARKFPRSIYAVDIHTQSVCTTQINFYRLTQKNKHSLLQAVQSDLFKEIRKKGLTFDLILFNPPAVSIRVSTNPHVIRNISVGASLLKKFFKQISDYKLLSTKNGEIFLPASNTAELRTILLSALTHGFRPEIAKIITHPKPYQDITTFLFRFTTRLPE